MKVATIFTLFLASASAFTAPQFATRAVGKPAPKAVAAKKVVPVKTAPAKKVAPVKAVAKPAPVKKAAPVKVVAKKAAPVKAVAKAPVKKAAPVKVVAKKAAPVKAVVKKVVPAKKAAVSVSSTRKIFLLLRWLVLPDVTNRMLSVLKQEL